MSTPLALRLAGRRWFPLWAVVRHRGRNSGREYALPVAVFVADSTEHTVTRPTLVGPDIALEAAGRIERQILNRIRVDAYLELER